MHLIKICCFSMILFVATVAHADQLCFEEAGVEYGINPQILKAIARVESNFKPRAINWNRNGTYDFGIMQINSSWYYTLGKEWWSTLGDPCSNIRGGAKILSGCMKKYGYSWEAIGCYNSQTPSKRDRYAQSVYRQLKNIQQADSAKAEKIAEVVVAESTVPKTGDSTIRKEQAGDDGT
jgi:soluble lytic murein transglycosylase-like protein